MRQLYLARDRIEAQLLHDFLDRHLVSTVILRDYLSGAAGELPLDICPSVWVIEDAQLERGRELLGRFLAQGPARGDLPAWTCGVCGESVDGDFDLCWRCGTARSERPD